MINICTLLFTEAAVNGVAAGIKFNVSIKILHCYNHDLVLEVKYTSQTILHVYSYICNMVEHSLKL